MSVLSGTILLTSTITVTIVAVTIAAHGTIDIPIADTAVNTTIIGKNRAGIAVIAATAITAPATIAITAAATTNTIITAPEGRATSGRAFIFRDQG